MFAYLYFAESRCIFRSFNCNENSLSGMFIFITIPYYFWNDINSKLTYMLAKFREMQEVK